MKKLFYLLVIFTYSLCSAQTEQNDSTLKNFSGVSVRMHYGFFIAHRYNIQHMSNAHFPMLELNYTVQTTGNKKWHQNYYMPTYGIGYCISNAGNKEIIGITQAVFPYINFNYLRHYKYTMNFRLGAGLGHIQKPFDRINNHTNLAIGSHFNCYINIGQDLKIKIGDRSTFNLGVHLHHQSNGAFKVPNLGINLATVNTGFTYYFSDLPKTLRMKKDTSNYISNFQTIVTFAGFVKEIYPLDGPKYPVFSVSLQELRQFNEKSRWGVSVDYMRNSAIKQYNKEDGIIGNENDNIGQLGATLMYEVVVGKLSFPLQTGAYIYTKYKDDGSFYSRIGVRYNVAKHILAGISLKTHFAKADYAEWSLGYKF